MEILGTILMLIIGFVVVAAVVGAISAGIAVPVYFLWNALVPDLFNGPVVTYMQTWGLLWLVWLLLSMINSGNSNSK